MSIVNSCFHVYITDFKVSNQSQPSPGYNYVVSAHKPTAVQACATGMLRNMLSVLH